VFRVQGSGLSGGRAIRPIRLIGPIGLILLLAAGAAVAADAPEVIYRRAQKLEQEGKVSHAIKEYRLFLKNHPTHSQVLEAQYRLAKCLDSIGMIDEAVQYLQAVTKTRTKRFRNRADAMFLLGKLLGALDKHEDAAKVLERLLGEGAGLYEDEALNLCGGYYAVSKKYTDAAKYFNILKRRKNSKFAERAAYKLAMVWLEAGNLDLAVDAVSDLATRWPKNQEARGLMIRIADVFRQQRKYDQSIGICEQLKTNFPRSREGLAADYVTGLCYYDKKMFAKAEEKLISVARVPENVKSGLAAEAMMKAADIQFRDMGNQEKAMSRYEEAASIAREYAIEGRQDKILELCYFRLAEYYFAKRKWSVALEFYTLLRKVGTKINILPRILRCQAELGMDMDADARSDKEVEFIKKKIAENPGTFAAAEGEVFLADREFNMLKEKTQTAEPFRKVAKTYEDILRRYPATVLAEFHLVSYIYVQLGRCQARVYQAERETATGSDTWRKSIEAFEKALAVDAETPYELEALENIAMVADAAGQKQRAFTAYKKLYEITGEKYHENKTDAGAREEMTGYLRSMLSRADSKDTVEDAIILCRSIIKKEGVKSDSARYAFFYMADLYYLRKDFSTAAKTYREFIKTYGPRQGPDGNLAAGPWKVEQLDWKIEQVYEAAVRVAHSWYLQSHNQNMIKAYTWLVNNFPHHNKWVAEAQYWLAMEFAKGKAGKTPEMKRKMAEALWNNVVSPKPLAGTAAAPVEEKPKSKKKGRRGKKGQKDSGYYFWVRDRDMKKYVQPALIKCGELMSELKEHEQAAKAFESYLKLYPPPKPRKDEPPPPKDDYYAIARYALGREYISMHRPDKMVEVYKPYLDGMRDDKFRISALRFMGFHSSTKELKDTGVKAYATILDEYGTNKEDTEGNPIPVPKGQRVRQDNDSWNGIRMPPPPKLDLGQIRYALGHLCWKNEDWEGCIRALLPFAVDPSLSGNEFRAKSMYMVGQCYYKKHDYKHGRIVLWNLIAAAPKFEAVEEVYVQTAVGCTELKLWGKTKELYKQFISRHADSMHRPHMDLHNAVAVLGDGDLDGGIAKLKNIARSDTFEDVKADAFYYLGINEVTPGKGKIEGPITPRHHKEALRYLEPSVRYFARGRSCLAAAKSYMALKQWLPAQDMLNRTVREFPDSQKKVVDEAKRLLPVVRREAAKKNK